MLDDIPYELTRRPVRFFQKMVLEGAVRLSGGPLRAKLSGGPMDHGKNLRKGANGCMGISSSLPLDK